MINSTTTPTIVGAGLAGLIAAHAWPNAPVLEISPKPRATHRALLRFRSDAVAKLTGIEFRKVTVHKGIWADQDFRPPSIRWANLYAQKVVGRLAGDRSIWNIQTAERFIAPDNLYEQLVDAVGDRIQWATAAAFNTRALLISTAPLPHVLNNLTSGGHEFRRASIHVTRWHVPGADVFQTVYFPERGTGLYRASITGHALIAEAIEPINVDDEKHLGRAFGINVGNCERLESVEQAFGKIVPCDEGVRKQILFRLTHDHNIYSLGRFATWRNILLDDVVDDIAVIKRLLKTNNAYDVRRAAT